MEHTLGWFLERKHFHRVNIIFFLIGILSYSFTGGKEAEAIVHVVTILMGLRLSFYFKFIKKNKPMLWLTSFLVVFLGASLLKIFGDDINSFVNLLDNHLRSY